MYFMKKNNIFSKFLVLGLVFVLFCAPTFTSASSLTSNQINAIISLLQSFGADQSVITNVQASLTGITVPNPQTGCYTFNTNLRVGDGGQDGGTRPANSIDADVSALVQVLSREGLLNYDQTVQPGTVGSFLRVSYFSEAVASAVTAFQEKYRSEILAPNGLSHGTGYVGPSTRTKLNTLYGCGTTTPPPPTLNKPVISSFTSVYHPGPVCFGCPPTGYWSLEWSTFGATAIGIAPGSFTSTLASGSTSVTPSAVTTYTLTATNPYGSNYAQIVVDPNSTNGTKDLSITTTSIPSAFSGISYSASISATGGTDSYSWWISAGSLPPGLMLTNPVCIAAPCKVPAYISGTPTVGYGSYPFTITLVSGSQTVSKNFTINVGSY